MIERTLDFPFRVEYGAVASTTDNQKIWQDRVLAAVGTAIGERPMDRTDYGTTMAKTLFANLDDIVELSQEQVTIAFRKHLPYLVLSGVDVYEVYMDDLEQTYVQVDISYILPNGEEVTSEAIVGSLDQAGEFSVYESYAIPAQTNQDDPEAEAD